MYNVLQKLSTTPTFEHLKLDPNTFKHVLAENIVFVTKAFKNRLVIPAFDAFCENITRLVQGLVLQTLFDEVQLHMLNECGQFVPV